MRIFIVMRNYNDLDYQFQTDTCSFWATGEQAEAERALLEAEHKIEDPENKSEMEFYVNEGEVHNFTPTAEQHAERLRLAEIAAKEWMARNFVK